MLRRPPGHVALQRKCLAALALIVLPWITLVDAQQQHQPESVQHQPRSPPEADRHDGPDIATTSIIHPVVESPRIHQRRKTTTPGDIYAQADSRPYADADAGLFQDESAHTLSPDLSVRAPFLQAQKVQLAGLSQQIARSLDEWEVEDFVLLATVDGDLYASDRRTGQERWHLKAEHPMVETRHFRTESSVLDEDFDPIDHYIWVLEPARDGELYLWRPHDGGAGLTKMGWTMKSVVDDLSLRHDPENGVVYVGKKETTMVTLNAATGTILKEFGSAGTYVNQVGSESCFRSNALAEGDNEECSNRGTITLGRTEYTLQISRFSDGAPIAYLKYSEWGPNTRDNDLAQLNLLHGSKDKRYITGNYDGKIRCFDFSRIGEERPQFTKQLSSPLARVFDVYRRWTAAPGTDPDLAVLPQGPLPAESEDSLRLRNERVYVNRTEQGSWFALSGTRYPLIVDAKPAPLHSDKLDLRDGLNDDQMSLFLPGIHKLPDHRGIFGSNVPRTPLGIDAGVGAGPVGGVPPLDTLPVSEPPLSLSPPPTPVPTTILDTAKRLPQIAAVKVVDLVSNPAAIVLFFLGLWFYKDRLRHFNWRASDKQGIIEPQIQVRPTVAASEATPEQSAVTGEETELKTQTPEIDKPAAVLPISPPPSPPASTDVEKESVTTPESSEKEETPAPDSVPPAAAPRVPSESADKGRGDGPDAPPLEENGKPKKKAHRGHRGGQKHKKPNKKKREPSESRDDEPQESVEEVVKKAKELGVKPKLEPDILTVPSGGVEEISGPILKMGSLEVNEEQQLGTGSNGTVVFAGKWDGRDVAVKRMLVQFTEIASQETRLLRESDDHPNVIRYFAQTQRAAFLYIALELCQASLADVITRPAMFKELAAAGARDIPGVLYQVTNGLSHLHSLRIVHRDLKPQNILVNMGKNGKPRILVSDFGLCKKLEGGQSSFGATTAHAAGTSGWRAPELLLDDDAPGSNSMSFTDPGSSLPSASGSLLPGPEGAGPNSRRVTRAIDIFSLGLVFFYVLTKGGHPFDCGDRYMREVNIRKGKYNLEPLTMLGDVAFEAQDLIHSMLSANPKQRPTARDVMAHPFFWSAKKRLSFLCDVSDHFEKEPRDPPSEPLAVLEATAPDVVKGDFLKQLPKEFVDSLGKQRKYTGTRMLDLLRALRNKRNHYEDMPEALKKAVGPLPDGYLGFWTRRFPNLLITCWNVVYEVQWDETDRFREYYEPANL